MSENKDYEITNVHISNELSMKRFEDFYNNVFLSNFSDPKICENKEHYINILKSNYNITDKLFITLFHNNEDIIGGIIYVYLSSVNSGVIEYAAIDSKYRRKGFGKLLYKYAKKELNNAAKINNKKHVDYIFGEASKPEVLEDFNSYEKFWSKLGFKKLDLEYIQPPLNNNCAEDREYMLIVDSLMESRSISTETVKEVVQEYFRFSFNINRPEMNKQYKEMFSSIESKQIDIRE
jgi:GNAT superfamily N-acetyltransferase